MPKLENREKISNRPQIQPDYTELIKLYNRLDSTQKVEFQQKLASLLGRPLLPPQIEEHLFSLSREHYERMFVYAQLLLVS